CNVHVVPVDRPEPPHFPTRRSSDLSGPGATARSSISLPRKPEKGGRPATEIAPTKNIAPSSSGWRRAGAVTRSVPYSPRWRAMRSEEHTSELQSRENLVCRLLLEKK